MLVALYILIGLILLIVILALLAPRTYNVSREIVVSRPKSEVFEYLKSLKNMDEWSPWARKDPNMEKKFTGEDGKVGAISHWNGNKDVGEGEQEITGIVDGERIESELRFLKPWKSTSHCYLLVDEVDNEQTRVKWGFSGTNNKFPMNIMMLFMSMDKMVGKDFEEGLKNLKMILEK